MTSRQDRPQGEVALREADEKRHADSLTEHELEAIEDHVQIRAVAIFEVIRREGKTELHRPAAALLMSGLVAGMALGLSVHAQGLLRARLPDADWRPLIDGFGYSFGFLIVILGQMQLFTENTIKAVCPVLDDLRGRMLLRLGRLWLLVLLANVAGAVATGAALWLTRGYQPEVWAAMRAISHHALSYGAGETFLRAVAAGWLVAALVWMMPNADGARPLVIVAITWLIAASELAHVVAGATEASLLWFAGEVETGRALAGFLLPAALGNLAGGTVLFTILAWVQIRTELKGEGAAVAEGLRRNEDRRAPEDARR